MTEETGLHGRDFLRYIVQKSTPKISFRGGGRLLRCPVKAIVGNFRERGVTHWRAAVLLSCRSDSMILISLEAKPDARPGQSVQSRFWNRLNRVRLTAVL